MNNAVIERTVIARMYEPFELAWAKCTPRPYVDRQQSTEGTTIWFAQEWQRRLWGATWVWTHVLKHSPIECMLIAPATAPRQEQLQAIARGVSCSHEYCRQWHRLYRRVRCLEKLMSADSRQRMTETRQKRREELHAELRMRFGAIDDPDIRPSPARSESLPSAS